MYISTKNSPYNIAFVISQEKQVSQLLGAVYHLSTRVIKSQNINKLARDLFIFFLNKLTKVDNLSYIVSTPVTYISILYTTAFSITLLTFCTQIFYLCRI